MVVASDCASVFQPSCHNIVILVIVTLYKIQYYTCHILVDTLVLSVDVS
jgi:hypothetical protein